MPSSGLNRLTIRPVWSAVLAVAVLSACGEMGHDENGAVKGFLILQKPNGHRADFSIGGFNTQANCVRTILDEVQTYEAERSNFFWTNPEFTYGGFEQPGWERNVIVGSRCERQ